MEQSELPIKSLGFWWGPGGCCAAGAAQPPVQIGKHPFITFTSPCAGILKTTNAQGFYSSNAQKWNYGIASTHHIFHPNAQE